MEKIFSTWIGHAITILTVVASLGVTYGALQSRIGELERRMGVLENDVLKEVREMKAEVSDLRVRLAEMGQDIRWLKDSTGK